MQAKYELLNRSGVLSYEHDTAKFADVGGLERLKDWLRQRKPAFDGSVLNLDAPRGVLLLGVQGCGKSLAARAAAGIFDVPLLRLDFGAVYNKWHGESERNLRDTLRTAELMAPCVLWIDEIEKGIASGEGDSGTSRRAARHVPHLAGREKRPTPSSSRPPTTLRRCRPSWSARGGSTRSSSSICRSAPCAGKSSRSTRSGAGSSLGAADLDRLVAASEGFSGAELEQAVVSALYNAHATQQRPSAAHVLREIQATRPLSRVMAERIDELRQWAADRTIAAD